MAVRCKCQSERTYKLYVEQTIENEKLRTVSILIGLQDQKRGGINGYKLQTMREAH